MEYLIFKRGDIPLVISAPHGGMEEPGSFAFRTAGNRRVDMYTLDLAVDLAFRLERGWGRPYLVAGLLRRTIVDYNRPPDQAYLDPAAGRHYREFHGALKESVEQCLKKRGMCLLIDIHGSRGTGPGDHHLVMGTAGCAAMPPDMVRMLSELISGEGWRVRHDTGGPYRGGFIVRHYANGNDIVGVQLEINREVRQEAELRAGFSSSLAKSLMAFSCETFADPKGG